MSGQTIAATVVFAITYVLISLPRVPILRLERPAIALLGAVAMVGCGVPSMDEARRAINFDTLALLLGMMIVIAYLRLARFFDAVAAAIIRIAKTPRQLLVLLVFASGFLSALFVNDTICLLFTPIVLTATRGAALAPVPYLLALCLSANVGSVATLTGNPQNMLVGIASGISFGRFFAVQLPIAMTALGATALLLLRLFRRQLPAAYSKPPSTRRRVHGALIRRLLLVVTLVLAGFLLPVERLIPGLSAGQKLPFVALLGALLAMAVGRYRPARAFAKVNFGVLLFFSGLFVGGGGFARTGLLDRLHSAIAPHFGDSVDQQVAVFTGLTIVGSKLVSIVPFVLLTRDWIDGFARPELMWMVLATASTFAGILTVVGSVANLIVLEQSRNAAPIGFLAYFRVGLPVTLLTTALAIGLLLALERFTTILRPRRPPRCRLTSSCRAPGTRSSGAPFRPTRTAPPAPSPRRCSRHPAARSHRGGRATWRSARRVGPASQCRRPCGAPRPRPRRPPPLRSPGRSAAPRSHRGSGQ
ncbi:MAG: anion transporter [Planctomycetes bacterium]|nr:anion transporter [Planctomycetota bacterium]